LFFAHAGCLIHEAICVHLVRLVLIPIPLVADAIGRVAHQVLFNKLQDIRINWTLTYIPQTASAVGVLAVLVEWWRSELK
jgi:hypothetical protein